MITRRVPYDDYGLIKYALPTIVSEQFDMRRRQFNEINERIAGPGLRFGHYALRVGQEQAVNDYLCALVEVGAIPYREKYERRM